MVVCCSEVSSFMVVGVQVKVGVLLENHRKISFTSEPNCRIITHILARSVQLHFRHI